MDRAPHTRGPSILRVNIFDAMWNANPGQGLPGGPSIDSTRAVIESAAVSGVRVFRFFASLWGGKKSFWATNSTAYWNSFDEVMDAIASHPSIYVVPSIGYSNWHLVSNILNGTNETMNDVSFFLIMMFLDNIMYRHFHPHNPRSLLKMPALSLDIMRALISRNSSHAMQITLQFYFGSLAMS